MKQTLCRKYADLAGQLLMLLPLIFLLSAEHCEYAAICYPSLGIWQALSCGITAASDIKPAAGSRRFYGILLVWILALFSFCSLIAGGIGLIDPVHESYLARVAAGCRNIALTEAAWMVVILPIMAIWYVLITRQEILMLRGALRHRLEIHWKL